MLEPIRRVVYSQDIIVKMKSNSCYLPTCVLLLSRARAALLATPRPRCSILDAQPSRRVDSIIEQAIDGRKYSRSRSAGRARRSGDLPQSLWERALEPRREPMTLDTIFDLASLTKVIATTTAVMQLVEQGKLRMNDPVAKYLPEFRAERQRGYYGTAAADALLRAGAGSGFERRRGKGKNTALPHGVCRTPADAAGSGFVYSDINFIMLGALVERVSGETLDQYAMRHIFAPLKMTQTRFVPPAAWQPKIAPTQYDENEHMLRGVVHDPTARRMGGVAGHAGLFSTADDLAKFAQALLNGGGGILSALVGRRR